MPTPDPDDAVAVAPSPGYVKIPYDQLPFVNEKASAPDGHPAGNPTAAPSQAQVSFEQIINGLALQKGVLADHAERLAAIEARFAAQSASSDASVETATPAEPAAAAPATSPDEPAVTETAPAPTTR